MIFCARATRGIRRMGSEPPDHPSCSQNAHDETVLVRCAHSRIDQATLKEIGEHRRSTVRHSTSHRFHLMLQPMLAFWFLSTGFPASTASIAARRSRPVTGLLLPGRLSSSCPR